MKKLFLVLILLFPAITPANAEGALAISIPEGGLRDGFAFGWAVRSGSAQLAEKGAMDICREQAVKFSVPPERCKVIASFRNQCVSVAFDADERWAGWGVGGSREQAIDEALKKCGEGAKNCKTFDTDCDR